ncbi:MAG TPA: hypothetical protein VJL89_10665 [Thermodesulfovibrionia bacterium]|nr:hypothetical protein [Thermodesulfovibrionia bacterium]
MIIRKNMERYGYAIRVVGFYPGIIKRLDKPINECSKGRFW